MVYTTNDLTQETYTPGQVAKYYNVTTRTIQKWDNTGKLPFHRTPTNRRIITREELPKPSKKDGLYINTTPTTRKDAIYTRVSTQGQVNQGDLDRQALEILEQNQDLQNPIIIKDTASGLNSKR